MNTNYFSIEQDLKDKNLDITRKHWQQWIQR
jgi:hypothetical protein